MNVDAKTFQRLLPALQHLAKFSGANRAVVCKKYGLAVEDVVACITKLCGSLSAWDEEALDAAAKKFDMILPEWKPTAFSPSVTVHTAAMPARKSAKLSVEVAAPGGDTDDEAPVSTPESWQEEKPNTEQHDVAAPVEMKRTGNSDKYIQVLRALLSHQGLSENRACVSADLLRGSWSVFKIKHLGKGKPTRAQLLEVFGKLGGDIRAIPREKPAPQNLSDEQIKEKMESAAAALREKEEVKTKFDTGLPPLKRVRLRDVTPPRVAGQSRLELGGELFRFEVIVRLIPAGGPNDLH